MNGYLSAEAAYAWRAGRWGEAASALDREADTHRAVDAAPFVAVGTDVRSAVAEVRLYTGPHADAFAAVKERERRFTPATVTAADLDDLVDAYAEVLAAVEKDDPDDPAVTKVRERVLRLTHLRKFPSGEWLDLPVEPSLAAFRRVGGAWSVGPDGALVGRGDAGGLCLAFTPPMGERFELTGTMEVLPADDEQKDGGDAGAQSDDGVSRPPAADPPTAGFLIRGNATHAGQQWRLRPSDRTAYYYTPGVPAGRAFPMPGLRPGVNEFHLYLIGPDAWLQFNDVPGIGPVPFTGAGDAVLGLGGVTGGAAGTVVKYRDLKYRRVDFDRPPGA